VAIDGAVQQPLDGGHLPPPTDQSRLSTPDGAMPVADAQQSMGGFQTMRSRQYWRKIACGGRARSRTSFGGSSS
jgi:hypothetical protein